MLTGAMSKNRKKANKEELLKEMMLTPGERVLINMLFGGELTEEIMHVLLENFDIDHANQNYILMLSCLGYMKNWKYFPPDIIPRLKGVHRYHQVHNSMGIPWLVQQLRILSDAGIPIMLIKGLAMRTYYAKGTPRLMWDYDIAVPEERYGEALRLLCAGENFLKMEGIHSGAVSNGKIELDLHRWIFKRNEEENNGLWDRAVHFDFYGMNVCVPAAEDMYLHQLDTQFRNWLQSEAPERRIKWLYDCRCIWEFLENKDLRKLSIRAEKLHITNKTRIMLRFFMYYFPGLIKKKQFDKVFPAATEYKQWLKRCMRYKRVWNHYLQAASQYRSSKTITPRKSLWLIRMEIECYLFYKPDLKRSDPNITLWKYFKKSRDLNSFRDVVSFLANYVSHIQFRKSREGS